MRAPEEREGTRVSLRRAVREKKTLCRLLYAADALGVILSAAAFVGVGLSLWRAGDGERLLLFVFACAFPFGAVTLLRARLNAPRPYEVFDLGFRGKAGKSFPSRHAFCAFLIGGAGVFLCPPFALFAFAGGVLCAVTRPLLGLHFVRDTVAGAAMGLLSGLAGGAACRII